MVSNTGLHNPFAKTSGAVEQNANMTSDKRGRGAHYQRLFNNKSILEEKEPPKPTDLKKIIEDEKYEEAKDRVLRFHKILKDLLIENSKIDPQPARVPTLKNWSHLKKYEYWNPETNFLARVYKNSDHLVLIFQVNSKTINFEKIQEYFIRGYVLPQFKEAIQIYDKLRKKYQKEKIIITGYQLGGTIAEYTAFNKRDSFGVTFNGLGVATLYPGYFGPENVPNIINYVTGTEEKMLRKNHFGLTRISYATNYSGVNFGGLATKPSNDTNHIMNEFEHLETFQSTYKSKA